MQDGKTRWTHYSIAYHLIWIPKYRRKVLTGEVQKATKELIAECCERHDMTLLALETDQDHVHVCVSAPPRFSPAEIANLLKGSSSRYRRRALPAAQAGLRERASVDTGVLCGHGRQCVGGSHPALYYGVPREVASAALGALIPIRLSGMGILAPFL